MSRRRRHRRKRPWWLLLVLAVLGTQGWRLVDENEPSSTNAPTRSGPAAKVFEVLYGASMEDAPNNDGDSFKVRHKGQVHEFRLYYADCAEKRRHSYNGDRLREQGAYFGGLNEEQTVLLGQQAQAFTQQWLRERPFTVYTKWQSVFGSGRHYAFIVFPDGEDLSLKLVREGLARIHTTGIALPDGRSVEEFQQQLRAAEQNARTARRGGWTWSR